MRRTRAGFTLLEMLVAIAIFASLALMAQQVTNGVTRVNSAVAGHDQKLNLMQQTMSFLTHDLTQMMPRPVTITLSGRMQQQLGRTRSQQEYQQALWYSASAESLALSALSLSLKNEKRVHLEQPWASGPRFFPLPQGQIAVTLRDAQACFNLNALAQPTTASRPLAVQQLIALITRLDVPAYRAELIAESLWEFIDEDRSVQTRLGREDSEYLARSVPFYAANQPLADISEMRVVQGMDAGLYQKLKPLVCALPMTRQQININTLDVTQSVILEAGSACPR
ncbi:TPA: type II secretion system minor pseudopilin GspK [Escherichia coli]